MSKVHIGRAFGYNTYKTSTGYSFGCGAVKFSKKVVQNFLKELDRRNNKEMSEAEADYEKVRSAINSRGLTISKTRRDEIFKLFGYVPAKQAKPIKKVVKAIPVKRAPKKKK